MKDGKKIKVFVGMSGGVDSSVSAALLKERGFDVTGVFIKVWQPDWMACSMKEDRLDAMRAATLIGIPFITLDLEKEYKEEVVDYMISEYQTGKTPNPDVMCNRYVKFGGFFDWAMKNGANYVATGHYASIKEENGIWKLLSGKDQGKDQSYFLWTLTEKELSKTLFPVGLMDKKETRRLARKFNLSVAEKRDSQGLCFIGKVNIKEFLSHYISPKKGNVLDERGNVIGSHDGAIFLTLGERHGFIIDNKSTDQKPYYVVSRDIEKNIVTVSHKLPNGNLSIEKKEHEIHKTNWIGCREEQFGKSRKLSARVRHLGEFLPCTVEILSKERALVSFQFPNIVASGQSIVVYDGEVCLGGGIKV